MRPEPGSRPADPASSKRVNRVLWLCLALTWVLMIDGSLDSNLWPKAVAVEPGIVSPLFARFGPIVQGIGILALLLLGRPVRKGFRYARSGHLLVTALCLGFGVLGIVLASRLRSAMGPGPFDEAERLVRELTVGKLALSSVLVVTAAAGLVQTVRLLRTPSAVAPGWQAAGVTDDREET